MWFELVCQYLQSIGATDPSADLVKSIEMLWDHRKAQNLDNNMGVESDVGSDVGSENESDSEAFFRPFKEKQPLLYQVLYRVSRFRDSSFLSTGQANQGMAASLKLSKSLPVDY